MKKNTIYLYSMASLALLVPFPGRLAYGIILVILLNLLMLTGTLFRRLVSLLSLDNLLSVLIAVLLVSETVIFKQLLVLFSPLMALTLGFALFMPAVSSFIIGSLYQPGERRPLWTDCLVNLKQSGLFSLYALFVFAFRDLFGYGTLTLPARRGLVQLQVLSGRCGAGTFWASIPGALLLSLLCIMLSAGFVRNLRHAGESLAENGGDADAS